MTGKVFREISIEFDGKEYTFTPSNRIMRRIDAGLAPNSLMGVAHTMSVQQVPIYDIAYIVSEFIKAGGGNVSEDDVLAELFHDLQENEGAGIEPLVAAIAAVVSPPEAASKNSPAPVKTGAPKAKRKPTRK